MTESTKDEEQLHEEAEELRKETADGSPELAEHDRVAELERQLEEANSKARITSPPAGKRGEHTCLSDDS